MAWLIFKYNRIDMYMYNIVFISGKESILIKNTKLLVKLSLNNHNTQLLYFCLQVMVVY